MMEIKYLLVIKTSRNRGLCAWSCCWCVMVEVVGWAGSVGLGCLVVCVEIRKIRTSVLLKSFGSRVCILHF